MDSQKARDWEIERTVKELYNWVVKKMKGIKKNYLIILAVYLIALLATLIFIKYLFFILICLTIICVTVIITMVIPFFTLIKKQVISPKEYYGTIIKKEKEHMHLDDNLLSKMFEMRITNLRNSIFAYLLFVLTYTLTITFNSEKICQYSNAFSLVLCRLTIIVCALVGVLSIGILVYYSARLDRSAIEELDELFNQLKKESDDESAKSIEKSRTQE